MDPLEDKKGHAHAFPVWTWLAPLAAGALLLAEGSHLVAFEGVAVLVLAALLLGGAVFAAVHHAETVAGFLGQPLGPILLALAVTVIEVSLIVSVMLGSPESGSEVARDTVFAAVMIVLNGVVGLCLVTGGIRFHQQGFQASGASGALGVLGTLATLALILPNYTLAVPGPVYANTQLAFVAVVSLVLYGLFLFVQTVTHKSDFMDAMGAEPEHVRPPGKTALAAALMLAVALLSVVLLAEDLSPSVEGAVAGAGLPPAFVGVIIAAVVLLPEGVASLRAAQANRLQVSLNLALGSALASIGLTIPAVAITSLLLGTPLALGLEAEHIVLLVLTLFASTLSLATGRTTVLQGGVHLVIFGAFLVIAAIP